MSTEQKSPSLQISFYLEVLKLSTNTKNYDHATR